MENAALHAVKRRMHQRTSVLLQSTVQADDCRVEGVIRSLSASGARVEIGMAAFVGDRIRLMIRNIGEVAGRVVWTRTNQIGVEFDRLIDPALAFAKRPKIETPTYAHVYNYNDCKRPGVRPRRKSG